MLADSGVSLPDPRGADTAIEDARFPVPTQVRLRKVAVKAVGDVAALTAEELLGIRNLGLGGLRCGKLNLAKDNKCASCGVHRWVTERKENPGVKGASKRPRK